MATIGPFGNQLERFLAVGAVPDDQQQRRHKVCLVGFDCLANGGRKPLQTVLPPCQTIGGKLPFLFSLAFGRIVNGVQQLFQGFAAIAMSEYSIATGEKRYAERALEIFNSIIRMLETPGFLEPKYMDTMKSLGHSITMILVNTASRIRAAIDDPVLTERIDISIHRLRKYFMHPEYRALLECVGPEGEFIDNINVFIYGIY